MLVTGLSAFIAPWNTIESLDQRKARSSSDSIARRSTSLPSRSWNVTVPEAIRAGGLCSRLIA